MRERLRLAIPNKGRLLESTLGLLHDAGLVFEEHDRSLVARVQNHPLDILFVRTGDGGYVGTEMTAASSQAGTPWCTCRTGSRGTAPGTTSAVVTP